MGRPGVLPVVGEETDRDRRLHILQRLRPGERFVIPADHLCGLPDRCLESKEWHREARLRGIRIRARHDDMDRLVIYVVGHL